MAEPVYCPRCGADVPLSEWLPVTGADGRRYWQHRGAHRRESTPEAIVACGYRLAMTRPDLLEAKP